MCAARTMYKLYSPSTKNYLDCVLSHSHWTWDSDSHVTQISSSTAEIAVILRQALQVVLHKAFGSNQRSTSLPRSTSDSLSPLTLISCRLRQTELRSMPETRCDLQEGNSSENMCTTNVQGINLLISKSVADASSWVSYAPILVSAACQYAIACKRFGLIREYKRSKANKNTHQNGDLLW